VCASKMPSWKSRVRERGASLVVEKLPKTLVRLAERLERGAAALALKRTSATPELRPAPGHKAPDRNGDGVITHADVPTLTELFAESCNVIASELRIKVAADGQRSQRLARPKIHKYLVAAIEHLIPGAELWRDLPLEAEAQVEAIRTVLEDLGVERWLWELQQGGTPVLIAALATLPGGETIPEPPLAVELVRMLVRAGAVDAAGGVAVAVARAETCGWMRCQEIVSASAGGEAVISTQGSGGDTEETTIQGSLAPAAEMDGASDNEDEEPQSNESIETVVSMEMERLRTLSMGRGASAAAKAAIAAATADGVSVQTGPWASTSRGPGEPMA